MSSLVLRARRFSPAAVTITVLWLLSVAVMLAADRPMGWIALGFALYLGTMYAAVRFFVPAQPAPENDEVLRARGSRTSILIRLAIVVASLGLWFLMGFTFVKYIPIVSPMMRFLRHYPLLLQAG